MNYHNIEHDNMLNGEGLRVILWLAGCDHKCKGCHNPETWNNEKGLLFNEAAKQELFDQLQKDYIDGITLTGGDPLFEGNRKEIFNLVKEIKNFFPTKTIWLYTGYTLEQIKCDNGMKEIVRLIDVLVDGQFIENLSDSKLNWIGSSNQNIIYINNENI